MESATVQRLTDLNREFYDQHAENFADTRPRLAPGILRLLTQVPPGARVLELGCGDGKTARWLARHAPPALYLGLDHSAAMLERARRYSLAAGGLPGSAGFGLADLTAPGGLPLLRAAAFDWVLAFAVWHHLPGFETRARLLAAVADRLAPAGVVALSNWQFIRSARWQERVVPWAALGLTEAAVERGDYLLSWERKGQRGMRYVHVVDTAEARQLAEHAGLTATEVFSSDGRSNQLAEYVALRKV
jgi:tRNA (uracil-5-)-methyltransferase TRM9